MWERGISTWVEWKFFESICNSTCMNCYSMLAIVCGVELNKIEHMNETHNTVTKNARKKRKVEKLKWA